MSTKATLLAALTVAVAIAFSATITPARPNIAAPEAIGIAMRDGDLAAVSENGTTVRKLTAFGDVFTIFEPSAKGIILFGRAKDVPIEGPVPMTLWSLDSEDHVRQEIDDEVIWANQSENGDILIYETAGYQTVVLDRTSGQKQLLKGTEAEVSSDGCFVVYVAIPQGVSTFEMPRPSEGLALYDRTTGITTKLTDNPEDYNSFWVPDGTILFGSANPEDGSGAGLFRIRTDGSDRSPIVGTDTPSLPRPFSFPSERPKFTSNGQTMLFAVRNDPGTSLWRIPLDRSAPVNVTDAVDVVPTRDGQALIVVQSGSSETIPVR